MNISISQKYYVYTLSYPDGRVFYVGKGQFYAHSEVDRIDEHEEQAKGIRHAYNKRKIAAIREIWTSGNEVVKTKLAYFEDELDAYIYEWGLINATCYAESLTNICSGLTRIRHKDKSEKPVYGHRIRKPKKTRADNYPVLNTPICLKTDRGKVYHHVTDASKYSIKASTLKALLAGKRIYTWQIIECNCQDVSDSL